MNKGDQLLQEFDLWLTQKYYLWQVENDILLYGRIKEYTNANEQECY